MRAARHGSLGLMVMVMAAGCGAPTAPASRTAAPSALPTATATPTTALPTAAFLNIVPVAYYGGPVGIACPMWAVLANPSEPYSAAAVQGLGTFLSGVVGDAHGDWDADPGVPPSTAQVVHVGVINLPSPGTSWNRPWCAIAMQITNVGGGVVQIPQVGLRLTAAPVLNQDVYPLVEVCSVLGVRRYCGPQFGGGALPCSVYAFDVALGDGTAGADFAGTPDSIAHPATRCPEVTLAPNASVELVVIVTSALARDYPIEPFVQVSSASGTVEYGVPASAGHIQFADPSAFSCYQLAGGSFVLNSTGVAALNFGAHYTRGEWCA